MLVDAWWWSGILLSVGLSVTGALLAHFVGTTVLRARLTRLEFDVATLEERLLREIKTRASSAGVKARKVEEDLLDQIKPETQPQKQQPWWMQHVHPDLKQH